MIPLRILRAAWSSWTGVFWPSLLQQYSSSQWARKEKLSRRLVLVGGCAVVQLPLCGVASMQLEAPTRRGVMQCSPPAATTVEHDRIVLFFSLIQQRQCDLI